MHAIDAIPIFLSLEVTADLVRQGLRAPWRNGVGVNDPPVLTLDVLDASNTSPIVIRVPPNSLTVSDTAIGVRTGRVFHVVVAGVTGNTAANKLDEKPLRCEAWIAVATSPTTLELYDLDPSTGDLVPSVGNGAYTGGGTVSKAFADGAILIGREHVNENSAPPRIVMVPATEEDLPAGTTSSFNAAAIAAGEVNRARLGPSFRAQRLWYETHIWGPTTVEMGASTFGRTQLMKEAMLRAAQVRASGAWGVKMADWRDQHPDAEQRTKFGHWLVFGLGLDVPITRDAVEFAPDPLVLNLGLSLSLTDNAEEA